VVVNDLYIFGAGVGPIEADTPLIIDTHTVLPLPHAPERFKPITRGHPQIFQSIGDLQLPELSPGNLGDIDKSFYPPPFGERFSIVAFE
jgi:hypothetical protein